jgi:hypothetical protein
MIQDDVDDFNEDNWPDLLVTMNDAPLQALENLPHPTHRVLRVKLSGPPGNPDCIGARVTVYFDGAEWNTQTAEISAGGGYLAQSSTRLSFGCGAAAQPRKVEICWPSGTRTEHELQAGQLMLEAKQALQQNL